MDKDLQSLSNATASIEEKIMRFFKSSMAYIVLAISIALTVVKSLFSFGISNPFASPQFWIDLGGNILTTIATYAAFCIHGSEEFKATNQPYLTNLKAWGEYSARIRKECPSEFLRYCLEYAKNCAEQARKNRFERVSLIPWEMAVKDYIPMLEKDLKAKVASGDLSASDYKAIMKAKKPVKPPKISATAILCGSDSVSIDKIADAHRNYVAQSIILRPFTMLLFSAGFAMVTPVFNGVSSADIIFSIISSAFMIMVAAVSGNTSGNNGARREAADIKAKIYFLDTFSAKISQKPLTSENDGATM